MSYPDESWRKLFPSPDGTLFPLVDIAPLRDDRPRRLRRLRPRTPEDDVLARYNSEVARGLVHTDEWREQMAVLQATFDRGVPQDGTAP